MSDHSSFPVSNEHNAELEQIGKTYYALWPTGKGAGAIGRVLLDTQIVSRITNWYRVGDKGKKIGDTVGLVEELRALFDWVEGQNASRVTFGLPAIRVDGSWGLKERHRNYNGPMRDPKKYLEDSKIFNRVIDWSNEQRADFLNRSTPPLQREHGLHVDSIEVATVSSREDTRTPWLESALMILNIHDVFSKRDPKTKNGEKDAEAQAGLRLLQEWTEQCIRDVGVLGSYEAALAAQCFIGFASSEFAKKTLRMGPRGYSIEEGRKKCLNVASDVTLLRALHASRMGWDQYSGAAMPAVLVSEDKGLRLAFEATQAFTHLGPDSSPWIGWKVEDRSRASRIMEGLSKWASAVQAGQLSREINPPAERSEAELAQVFDRRCNEVFGVEAGNPAFGGGALDS